MSSGPPPPYSHLQQGLPQRIIIIPRQDGNYTRTRRGGFCAGCARVCAAPFLLIAFCFGLWPAKLERINRLAISFFTFAAIALSAGLLLGLVTYGQNEFEASPADMRPFDAKYSSSLCSHFEVSKANAPVDVYFLDKMPRIREGFRKNYLIEVDPQFIDFKHYEVVNFYMLKGSRLEVYSQSDALTFPPVSIYLIKGSYNLGEWTGDHDCCYLKKDTISSMFSSYFDYNITETDEYYITMALDGYAFSSGSGTTVNAKFVLQKTVYDVSEASVVCTNYTDVRDGSCGQDLRYGSDQVAVMYAPGKDKSGELVKKYKITTKCAGRLLLYIPCFLVVPLVAYVLWAAMLWFCFPETPAQGADQEQMWSQNAPGMQTVNTSDEADLVTNQVLSH